MRGSVPRAYPTPKANLTFGATQRFTRRQPRRLVVAKYADMTLKQLEAFYLAATLGSFSLAAQRAHVTQSSLSKRIAELGAFLNAELFDRASKRARLTEAGDRLLSTAAQMLALREGVKVTLRSPAALTGMSRFGISELGALTCLPRLVALVREQHPQLTLHPHGDLGRRLERQVARGELDFAIVPGPPEDPHIAAHVIVEVRFAWSAAVGRIKGRRVLSFDDLSQHPCSIGRGRCRANARWIGHVRWARARGGAEPPADAPRGGSDGTGLARRRHDGVEGHPSGLGREAAAESGARRGCPITTSRALSALKSCAHRHAFVQLDPWPALRRAAFAVDRIDSAPIGRVDHCSTMKLSSSSLIDGQPIKAKSVSNSRFISSRA